MKLFKEQREGLGYRPAPSTSPCSDKAIKQLKGTELGDGFDAAAKSSPASTVDCGLPALGAWPEGSSGEGLQPGNLVRTL
jgi:hypothetical protein